MVTEMTWTGVRGLSPVSVGTLLIFITMSMPDDTCEAKGRDRDRAGQRNRRRDRRGRG
jgi:hypothetical protein